MKLPAFTAAKTAWKRLIKVALRSQLLFYATLCLVVGVGFSAVVLHTTPVAHHQTVAAKPSHHTAKVQTPADASTVTVTAEAPVSTVPQVAAGPSKSSQARNLVISRTSFILYKPNFSVRGVKSLFQSQSFQLSMSDGARINYPFFTAYMPGMILNSQASPAKPTWNVDIVDSNLSTPGTYNVSIGAQTLDTTMYTVPIQITIKDLPVFDIAQTTMYAQADSLAVEYDFNGLYYADAIADEADVPKVSLLGADFVCDAFLDFSASTVYCVSSDGAAPGTHNFSFVFENQYQRLVIPAQLTVTP